MKLWRLAVTMTAAVALMSGAVFSLAAPSRASDHQDSPTVVAEPGADITDLYVFPSPYNSQFVDFAMDIHPLIPAGTSGNVSFNPNVLYQIKIGHGPLNSAAPPDTYLQFTAHGTGPGQRITVYGASPALPKNGPIGTPLGTVTLNAPPVHFKDGIVAFAGARADPFFFDLFQFFSILPDRYYKNPRTGDQLGSSKPTFNGFAAGSTSGRGAGNYACSTAPSTNALTQVNGGFNVLSVVIEIPKVYIDNAKQSPIVHVWGTVSVPRYDYKKHEFTFRQIELLSRPAVKELFEPFKDHEITNGALPDHDPVIANDINTFMRNVAGRSPAIAHVVTSVLFPNKLIADLSQPGPAAYLGVETGGATGSKFGGRGLTDDVIDTSLGVVFGSTIPALGLAPPDYKENLCLANEHVTSGQGGVQTQSTFPYLATPH